jgi:hypothetical protein
MNQTIKLSAILLFVLAALLVWGYFWKPNNPKYLYIKTFEECAKAGYKIMESFPRQCGLPNGQFFVESQINYR